jgi:hypothetical protein
MSFNSHSLLENVPDWGSSAPAAKQLEDWLNRGKKAVLGATPESIDWGTIQVLEFPDGLRSTSPLGCATNPTWRKWVLGLYLADLVSYALPSDQVEFNRLSYLTVAFPEGFALFWIQIAGEYWPAGYTGWYPMSSSAFETFEKRPESLQDRTVVPKTRAPSAGSNPTTASDRPFLYLFNYSVAPPFKKSRLSKTLMKHYAQNLAAQNPQGLAAITVSDEGCRVASRFGMKQTGQFKIGNEVERVFTGRC